MDNTVIAAGMTAKQLVDHLKGNEAEFAAKALNYYDGKQQREMEQLLSDPQKGRSDWRRRGMIARHRNLTKMIVEKSGMLFKDALPQLEVRRAGSDAVDQQTTEMLVDMLDKTEWQEVLINLDVVVRLLKTAILLVQWDSENEMLVFDILHRANSAVVINPSTKGIDVLVQRTGQREKSSYYRVWTADAVIDIEETEKSVHVVSSVENTYGTVPATVFYDTAAPRSGFWVEAPHDLVNMNEMYNLHLTDSEFVISWMKRPCPVTNCTLDGAQSENFEVAEVYGSPLPRAVAAPPKMTFGPDTAVMLGTSGGEAPFFEFKAASVDIKSMDEVVHAWIKQTAADWSVRVRADGDGTATSGFQVVVEEAPNLELRQLRQRMFEAGLKRLYRKLKAVAPAQLPEDGELFAVFGKPSLPVDIKAQEDVWTVRINEGRATEIDYLMEVHSLSKEEATAKWLEIVEFRQAKAKLLSVVQPQPAAEEEQVQEDGQPAPEEEDDQVTEEQRP